MNLQIFWRWENILFMIAVKEDLYMYKSFTPMFFGVYVIKSRKIQMHSISERTISRKDSLKGQIREKSISDKNENVPTFKYFKFFFHFMSMKE